VVGRRATRQKIDFFLRSDRKKAKPSQSPLEAKYVCGASPKRTDKCPEGKINYGIYIVFMFLDGTDHKWVESWKFFLIVTSLITKVLP
jgi:hypothetical protein